MGHPSRVYGIGYIMNVPLLSSCFGLFFLSLDVEYIFGRLESFLSMFLQQLVVILVFSWKELSSSTSTLPSCLQPQLLLFWTLFLLWLSFFSPLSITSFLYHIQSNFYCCLSPVPKLVLFWVFLISWNSSTFHVLTQALSIDNFKTFIDI